MPAPQSPASISPPESAALDPVRLRRHLAGHGLILDEGFAPERFAAGFGNLNYLIRANDAYAVLRRPPLGPIPPGANDMAREFRILSHLHAPFPLVPRALHFCDDTEVLGAPFFLMEYRPGLVIGAEIPQETLANWTGAAPIGATLGDTLITVLAGLHAVDYEAAGLATLGRPEGFLARTLRGWTKRADLSWSGTPPPDLAPVLTWLQDNLPATTPRATLIHNDFKLDNVILVPETLTPRTVIDWDMGTLGDPLYDLAVLLSYWTEPGDPQAMRELRQMPTDRYGFASREEAARLYAERSGRSVEDFAFYRVLGLLRLSIVFQQLYRRYETGGTTDPAFAGFGGLARGLLSFGHDVAKGRYF